MNNENIKYIKFHCNLTVRSSLKFGLSIPGVLSIGGEEVEFFEFKESSKKHLWGRTRRRRIACFNMIRRLWVGLKSGEPISWVRSIGEGGEFLENSKEHQWGRTRRRRIASFIVIRWMEVGLKSGYQWLNEKKKMNPFLRPFWSAVNVFKDKFRNSVKRKTA